ncbi:MAG: ComEC/Rec2 family competence protein [Bacteroidales bacterium]|nr:ComEC/Rec2 family competence protein [Bacteroidales bacterium]
MKDSGEIVGIGMMFAAGVAVGAVFAEYVKIIPLAIPCCLSMMIPTLSVAVFLKSDSKKANRLSFLFIFFLTGLFCSINSKTGYGIPVPKGYPGRLAAIKGEQLKRLIDSIPYPSAGTGPLVKALLTGDRSGLDKTTVNIFRASGASHILALSGLHLGILYLILSRLTVPLGNRPGARRTRFLLTFGTAGFYTLMTGASPSIVRAFLYITIGETARLLGRERAPVNILLTALTIQLALKPEVITSLGFQLSYLAMVGITILYPRLEKMYPAGEGLAGRTDPMRKLWKGAVLSISCQVFTAPLVWYRFHTFPKYFLITNLTALPLTSAVMVLSVTTIALSWAGICPDLLIYLDDKAVSLLVECLGVISSL